MYTLQEIESEAKAAKRKVWWRCLFFGLGFIGLFFWLVFPLMVASYNPHGDNFFYYFEFILMLVFICGIFSLPSFAYQGKKKQLEEENRQEEQQKREDHYKRMEELLEKMSKDKESD